MTAGVLRIREVYGDGIVESGTAQLPQLIGVTGSLAGPVADGHELSERRGLVEASTGAFRSPLAEGAGAVPNSPKLAARCWTGSRRVWLSTGAERSMPSARLFDASNGKTACNARLRLSRS